MCAYYGGKSRNGKDIAEVIKCVVKKELKDVPKTIELIEPFCGMLGVTRHLVGDYVVSSSDYNEDLIYLLNHLKENPEFEMPKISREKFKELKNQNENSFEKSFALLFCTYMSYYRGSYAPESVTDKKGNVHNFHLRNYNNLKKGVVPVLNKINLSVCDYQFWDARLKNGGFIVYCDPPYCHTYQAYKKKIFDTEQFWTTVKKWKNYGNYVFVSELKCPIENIEVYCKSLQCTTSNKNKKMIDKLFYIL